MEPAAEQGSLLASFLPLIVLFVIFYFLVIRPQQTQAKKHKEMIGELKKGDKVITSGGFIVEIVKVEEEFFKIAMNEGSVVKVTKESIAKKVDDED